MRSIRRFRILLCLALALLLCAGAALGEPWAISDANRGRFWQLTERMETACDANYRANIVALDRTVSAIRSVNADDGDVAEAIAEHWKTVFVYSGYEMYAHAGEETAAALEQSGLDFGGRHAFVVLGYQLEDGEMAEELIGRCDAAAAAARSYPESILICTGGATGQNNPEGHTEAGEMKRYLSEKCGIDPERIYTEEAAMTTEENAVNTFRILEETGTETITLVTSDYHQRWAQVLYNAQAAITQKTDGYAVRIVGSYNYPARKTNRTTGYKTALRQLKTLLGMW